MWRLGPENVGILKIIQKQIQNQIFLVPVLGGVGLGALCVCFVEATRPISAGGPWTALVASSTQNVGILKNIQKPIGNQWFFAPVLGGGCGLRGRWCAFRRGKTLDHSEVQIHLLPSSTCFPTPLPPSPGDPGRPKCDPPPSLEPPPSLPRTRDLTFSRYPFRLASHLRIPAQREPLDSPKTGWTLHRGYERGGRMCPFRRREPLH